MINKSKLVGTMEPDDLIAGLEPAPMVHGATIRKGSAETTYKRGTIMAKSSGTAGDGKLVILGSTAASSETLTADCILCDDVTVGTGADEAVAVYVGGCFNANKAIVKAEYDLTEADKDALRVRGIILKAEAPAK